MGKFLVRMTVIFVAIYFIVAALVAQLYGVDILTGNHALLFELITVVYTFEHGKYHCRFLRWTMLSLFIAEIISRLDNSLNFLTVDEHNYGICVILLCGLGTSVTKALLHFKKVSRLKRKRAKLYGSDIDNKLRGIEYDKENGM